MQRSLVHHSERYSSTHHTAHAPYSSPRGSKVNTPTRHVRTIAHARAYDSTRLLRHSVTMTPSAPRPFCPITTTKVLYYTYLPTSPKQLAKRMRKMSTARDVPYSVNKGTRVASRHSLFMTVFYREWPTLYYNT